MRIMDFKGVIKLYEVFENDSYIFLVCELLQGGELFNHMKGKAYDEKTVASIMFRILQSVDYIHSKKVLHRDIKVRVLNILARKSHIEVEKRFTGRSDCWFWPSRFLQPQGWLHV